MISTQIIQKHVQCHSLKYASGFLLALCLLVYYPGTSGAFIFDDIPNIVANPDIGALSLQPADILRSAFSSYSGPLRRPVSMLSFAINYRFAGFDPYTYKLTNIVIHLLNGALIGLFTFLVLRQLRQKHGADTTDVKIISLAVAAVWLLHPVNLTTVLYVVQRMNELATTFTLAGLALYIAGRMRMQGNAGGKGYLLTAFFICGPLAMLAKENGTLFYLYAGVTEILLFERRTLSARNKSILHILYLIVLLPVVAAGIAVLINPQLILEGYMNKDFTLVERLMTEARVIWFYVYLIVLPDIQQMSLHHDGIALSRGIIEPVTTLTALTGLLAVIILAVWYRKKYPLVAFGVLFFLAGHSLESTFLPLVIAFEHRNYLPSYGLILLICTACLQTPILPRTLPVRRLFLVLFLVVLAFATNTRARQWGNTEMLRFYELKHNPDSPQVNYEAGRFYAMSLDTDYVNDRELVYDKAAYYFSRVLDIEPFNIEALAGLLILKASNKNMIDYELFSRLYDVLANRQISNTGIGAIKGLLTCQIIDDCSFPERNIEMMVQSIENNKNLNRRRGELMYSNISRYYRDSDRLRALQMARKALEYNNRSLDMRIYLARLLIDMNRRDEATRELDIIEQMDILNLYKDTTDQLKALLFSN